MKSVVTFEAKLFQLRKEVYELTEDYHVSLSEFDYNNVKTNLHSLQNELDQIKSKSFKDKKNIQDLKYAVSKLLRQVEYCSHHEKEDGTQNTSHNSNIDDPSGTEENQKTQEVQDEHSSASEHQKPQPKASILGPSNALPHSRSNKSKIQHKIASDYSTVKKSKTIPLEETCFNFQNIQEELASVHNRIPEEADSIESTSQSHRITTTVENIETQDDYDSDGTEFEMPLSHEIDIPEVPIEQILSPNLINYSKPNKTINIDMTKEPTLLSSLPTRDSNYDAKERYETKTSTEGTQGLVSTEFVENTDEYFLIDNIVPLDVDKTHEIEQDQVSNSQSLLEPYVANSRNLKENYLVPLCYQNGPITDNTAEKATFYMNKKHVNADVINCESKQNPEENVLTPTQNGKEIKTQGSQDLSPLVLRNATRKLMFEHDSKNEFISVHNKDSTNSNCDKDISKQTSSPFKTPPTPRPKQKKVNLSKTTINSIKKPNKRQHSKPYDAKADYNRMGKKDQANSNDLQETNMFKTIEEFINSTLREKTLNYEINHQAGTNQKTAEKVTNLKNVKDHKILYDGSKNNFLPSDSFMEPMRIESEDIQNTDGIIDYRASTKVSTSNKFKVHQLISKVSEVINNKSFKADIKTPIPELQNNHLDRGIGSRSNDLDKVIGHCSGIKQNSSQNSEMNDRQTQADSQQNNDESLSSSQINSFLSDSQIDDNNENRRKDLEVKNSSICRKELKLTSIMEIRTISKTICFRNDPESKNALTWTSEDLKHFT